MLGILLACLLATIWSVASFACSQCECGSPTPPGYALETTGGRFRYGLEDRYLSKENVLAETPGIERQTEHRIAALLFYRPSGRIGLQARLPYVLKANVQSPVGQREETTHVKGFGDADLLARLEMIQFGDALSPPRTLALVGNVTIPSGSNERRDASGARFDAHLQPGSGAWDGMAGVALDASLPHSSALSASILGRVNGTNAHGYHYGDALLGNVGYARALSPTWEAAVGLNGRTAAHDVTEDGTEDPNSGGALLYVAPSVRWGWGDMASIQLLVQIPVAQALHGDQSEHPTVRAGIVFLGM
jgi:hypothetical protein